MSDVAKVQWEYKALHIRSSLEKMNEAGREGWELVLVDELGFSLIFKRPIDTALQEKPE